MDAVFSLKDVSYRYDNNTPILSDCSINSEGHSFNCLVGPSGIGKTTILNLLGLLDAPDGGTITILGSKVSHMNEREKEQFRLHNVGFIFQSFYLLPTLTILENTMYFLPLIKVKSREAKDRAHHILELLQIDDQANKYPHQLSGGQRQRATIARALVKNPNIVLADEPTANLDTRTSNNIIKVLKKMQEEYNISFFFATHDNNLMSYADNIYTVEDYTIKKVP